MRYDMVFVPDPPLSAVTFGAGDGFPRAVPSDAVVGLLARVLPADAVQAVLLLAVFVLGAAGAARLVPVGVGSARGPDPVASGPASEGGSPVPADRAVRRAAEDLPDGTPAPDARPARRWPGAGSGGRGRRWPGAGSGEGAPGTAPDRDPRSTEAAPPPGGGRVRRDPPVRVGVGGLVSRVAAGVFYVWNPFVAERLLLGQWALLLGYAGLPWVVAAAVRLARARDLPGVVVALLPAAVGGFSSIVLSALAAVPTALLRRAVPAGGGGGGGAPAMGSRPAASAGTGAAPDAGSAFRRGRRAPAGAGPGLRVVMVVGALAVVALPWLVPALGSGAGTDPAAVDAFAARADTPFGTAASLLALGGIWNAQAVPEWYGQPVAAACRLVLSLAALAGWAWLVRRGGVRFAAGLSVAAAVGFGIALLGTVEPGRDVLRALIGAWPGFGPLRDGQLYVAPLALLQAVGFGGAVAWVCAATRTDPRGGGPVPRRAVPDGRPAAGSDAGSGPVRGGSAAPSGSGVPAVPGGAGPSRGRPGGQAGDGAGRVPGGSATGGRRPGPRGGSASAAVGGAVAAVLAVAPVVLLPGLAWGAAGRLAPVGMPAEWTAVQRIVAADERPGAVLVLPWSAYRGLDWTDDGRTVVVLDPAVKLFDRRVVWNDDLRVGGDDGIRVVSGEDPLARSVERVAAEGPAASGGLERLGAIGVRYVLVEREAFGGTDPSAPPDPVTRYVLGENVFSSDVPGASPVHDGRRLALFEVPDEHVEAANARLSGLEVTGWSITVGAIFWSIAASGSSLISMRPAGCAGVESRKEGST
ncbi:hypothetical protein ACFO4E_09520 [Nocardiopsis mangrovi]|uniref:Uncharacterized protein n=1 Tax=Nocardiopsis mangrovi TaxID=1179818 RepID=A0ABV9DWY6_9ACTN